MDEEDDPATRLEQEVEGRPDQGKTQDGDGIVGEPKHAREERSHHRQQYADGELNEEGGEDRIDRILGKGGALFVDLAQCAARMDDIAVVPVIVEEGRFEPNDQDRHDRDHR
ncbi:hypothetical protein D3C87_1903880 [compost metagenome]